MTDIKLTKAQREHLEFVASAPTGRRMCASNYRPHIALVSLGLATEDIPKFAIQRAVTVVTPAGRAWLAANPRRKK